MQVIISGGVIFYFLKVSQCSRYCCVLHLLINYSKMEKIYILILAAWMASWWFTAWNNSFKYESISTCDESGFIHIWLLVVFLKLNLWATVFGAVKKKKNKAKQNKNKQQPSWKYVAPYLALRQVITLRLKKKYQKCPKPVQKSLHKGITVCSCIRQNKFFSRTWWCSCNCNSLLSAMLGLFANILPLPGFLPCLCTATGANLPSQLFHQHFPQLM